MSISPNSYSITIAEHKIRELSLENLREQWLEELELAGNIENKLKKVLALLSFCLHQKDSCDRISELPRNTIVIQAQKAERDAQIYKLRVCGRREIAHTPNNNLMK
ncbi:unnamed protein product [Prunus armeniaca]